MASDPRDDVDRLFDCFKCGISTPQSAATSSRKKRRKCADLSTKERGSSYRDVFEGIITEEGTGITDYPWPASTKKDKHKSVSIHPCPDKLATPIASMKKFNGQNQISPVVFYGSPHGVPAKRPLQLLRLLREIRVDLTEQNEFNPRKDIWATFPKQDQAMSFAKNHAQVHIFSYQDHLNGQRRFLVTTYKEFWRRYKVMDSKVRHHYEVIQEGRPCHLYFDLEFDRKINKGKNGDEMVDILISVMFSALYEKYSIVAEHEWIVELDSTTEEKFSRHLLIRIPGAAFKDNSHVGAFVAEDKPMSISDKDYTHLTDVGNCNVCAAEVIETVLYASVELVMINSTTNHTVDEYKKLYAHKLVMHEAANLALKSSSFQKTPVALKIRVIFSLTLLFILGIVVSGWPFLLKQGRSLSFYPLDVSNNEEQMFMDSLICRMDVDCKKVLICKMDLECMKTLHFDAEISGGDKQNLEGRKDIVLHSCTSDFPGTYLTGTSPFPALDRFVGSIASTGNVSGQIRCWYWFSEFGLMVYSMLRNRYCERIGREHKSNHVMYVVDFRTAGYYQKCYDPDCKGYRSPLRPIPLDIVPDDAIIYNLGKAENYKEQMSLSNTAHGSDIHDENVTDSCKKNGAWWREVIELADDIEKLRKASDFGEQELGFCDDQDWWMDAERFASLLEQQ